MTDIKPFVNRESPSPRARSVSVVFSVKGLDAQQPQSPGMLDPLGSTCLFDRMLSVLLRVGEAEHKAVWFDDAALVERFEKTSHPSIRLLSGPPNDAYVQEAQMPFGRPMFCCSTDATLSFDPAPSMKRFG